MALLLFRGNAGAAHDACQWSMRVVHCCAYLSRQNGCFSLYRGRMRCPMFTLVLCFISFTPRGSAVRVRHRPPAAIAIAEYGVFKIFALGPVPWTLSGEERWLAFAGSTHFVYCSH